MAIDTNKFFLTAPFKTDTLKQNVARDKARLEQMEQTYAELHAEYVTLCGDLTIMEEKSGFLERQVARSMTIFEPPPEGAHAEEMAKKQVVYDVLYWSTTVLGGVSGVMMIVGHLGLTRTVKASLGARNIGAVSKIKAGAKLGRAKIGAGRAVIGAARGARVARATSAAKLGKWGKIAKVGRVSGVASVALVAIDIGLKMADAAKMNAYFLEQADEIGEVITEAETAVAALKSGIAEGNQLKAQMLADAGCATINAYLEKLNRAIADVGRANARRSLVRRMLLDGMSRELVQQYSELSEDEVARVDARLQAELGLLRDKPLEELVAASGLTTLQVEIIQRLFHARMALLEGNDAQSVAADYGLSDVTVSGVATSLARDIRQVWALLEKSVAPVSIGDKALFPAAVVEQFAAEIAAKRLLHANTEPGVILKQTGITPEQLAAWSETFVDDLASAVEMAATAEAHIRRTDIAADFRVPVDLLSA